MAYTDTIEGGGRRRAVAGVALVHAALGYALVVGLATTFTERDEEDGFVGFEVPVPTPTIVPPPPMPEPTASERTEPSDSIVILPEPGDAPLPPSGPPIGMVDGPPFDGSIGLPTGAGTGAGTGPIIRPLPSPSPSTSVPPAPPPDTPARARGDASRWIGTADYRPSWIRRGLEGTVGFALSIGADGRVTGCSVTASSSHAALDRATCALVTKRARFEPAVSGRTGRPVAGAYRGRVQWVVPG